MNNKSKINIYKCGSSARSGSANLSFYRESTINSAFSVHRIFDSVFGTLKQTLETTNVYQKPSTTNNHHTKQQKNTHLSKNLKLYNSKIPKIRKSKNPKLFTSTQSCHFWGDFWISGFSEFRSRCPITVVDKSATCNFCVS